MRMRLVRATLMLLLLILVSTITGAHEELRPFSHEVCATTHHDCRRHCSQAELPELLGNVWQHEQCIDRETGDVTRRGSHRHSRQCCWL